MKKLTEALKESVTKVKDGLDQARRDLESFIKRNHDRVPVGGIGQSKPLPRVVVLAPERPSSAVRGPDELIHRFEELQLEEVHDCALKAALLRQAAAFRRARHVLALKAVWDCKRNGGETKPAEGKRGDARSSEDRESTDQGTGPSQGGDDFFPTLRDLSDNDDRARRAGRPRDFFFSYQEGSFYKMHYRVRDFIYATSMLDAYSGARNPAREEFSTGDSRPSLRKIHGAAAEYYERLFVHSNSLPPFFESVYHRIAAHRILSLSCPKDAGDHADSESGSDLQDLLRTLYALLGQARRALLDGPPAQVLAWLEAMQEEIELLPDTFKEQTQRLIHELAGLRARVYSVAGDDRGCFEVRMRQVKRLIDPETAGCANLADVKRWLKHPSGLSGYDLRKMNLEIAEALESAGNALAAIEIGWGGRHAVISRTGETAEDYLEQALDLGKELSGPDSKTLAHPGSFVKRAVKLPFRCNLSLADLILDQAERDLRHGKPVDPRGRVDEKCEKAKKVLEEYSHRFPEYLPSDRAAVYIRRARCRLLFARGKCDDTIHREAYRYLEDARAEAYVGRGEEDRELIAEIRLRTAEGLWNQASALLSVSKKAVVKGERVPKIEVDTDHFQVFLNRTRVHLEQARSALADGPSNFKALCMWEQLHRCCDDLQLKLVGVLLEHTQGLLPAIKRRPAQDSGALEQTSALLEQAHSALSISPPSSRLWEEWRSQHERWRRLHNRRENLRMDSSRRKPRDENACERDHAVSPRIS